MTDVILDRLAAQLQQPLTDTERMAMLAATALELTQANANNPSVQAVFFASIASFEIARADYEGIVRLNSLGTILGSLLATIQGLKTAVEELQPGPG